MNNALARKLETCPLLEVLQNSLGNPPTFQRWDKTQHDSTQYLEIGAITIINKSIGQPIRRKEDKRLVTGRGKFSDDFHLLNQVHAVMVRSS